MFSVVVPTMWRGAQLAVMLPAILNSPAVGEVILIDNDRKHRPAALEQFLSHPKLKIIDKGQNIYVNPAWNLGAEMAQFDQLCILSDDVLFDPGLFSQLTSMVTPEVGVIGVSHTTVKKERNVQKQGVLCNLPIKLVPVVHHLPLLCWGILMFVHKNNWSRINEEEFKIFYGDYWIATTNKLAGRTNYYMEGIQVCTQMTTTSAAVEFRPIADDEHSKAEDVFDRCFGLDTYRIASVYSDMSGILLKEELKRCGQSVEAIEARMEQFWKDEIGKAVVTYR